MKPKSFLGKLFFGVAGLAIMFVALDEIFLGYHYQRMLFTSRSIITMCNDITETPILQTGLFVLAVKQSPHSLECSDGKPTSRLTTEIPSRRKVIVIYNKPRWFPKVAFDDCPYTCTIVESTKLEGADLVLFHGVTLNTHVPPPRPRGQMWLMMGNEAPMHYSSIIGTERWRGVFNLTSTPRVDSDIFAPYGRLIVKHATFQDFEDSSYYESMSRSKMKNVLWVVSHCETQSLREEYVARLGRYIKVDVFGKCGKKMDCAAKLACSEDSLTKVMKPYKFYLAFENSLCADYVTEKFFRVFRTGNDIIPVVRGALDYDKYLPTGTFINTAHFRTPRLLASYLKRVAGDVQLYSKYLREISRYALFQPVRVCEICIHVSTNFKTIKERENVRLTSLQSRIYMNQSFVKNYEDIHAWLSKGKCRKPTDL